MYGIPHGRNAYRHQSHRITDTLANQDLLLIISYAAILPLGERCDQECLASHRGAYLDRFTPQSNLNISSFGLASATGYTDSAAESIFRCLQVVQL